MKHGYAAFVRYICLAFLLSASIGASGQTAGSSQKAEAMSIWRARRTVTAAAVFDPGLVSEVSRVNGASFLYTPDTLEFDEVSSKFGTRHSNLDLKTLDPLSGTCKATFTASRFYCWVRTSGGKELQDKTPSQAFLRQISAQGIGSTCYPGTAGAVACFADQNRSLTTFIDAIARLRAFANDTDAPLHRYLQLAADWRAQPTKPAIPEEVRVRRLLAEDAIKAKKPEEALAHYEIGLELYPTWPQGYFNAALIAAELGYFGQAVEHMQAYVDLVPDAADAPAARDQIAIWKFKAK